MRSVPPVFQNCQNSMYSNWASKLSRLYKRVATSFDSLTEGISGVGVGTVGERCRDCSE